MMNLGQLDPPILLFGGPYSNLEALIALKQAADSMNIPPTRIFCTGDIVAYCGSPSATVDLIRNWGIHVLMGNCEESFASNADDCGCGFEEGSHCSLLSVEWFRFANSQLNQDQRKWFSSLPRRIVFSVGSKTIHLVHGSATSINQFIFNSTDKSEFVNQFKQCEADIIIAGHSGIPFSKHIEDKLWHNTGAIGMPANDGTTNTWYSILRTENNTLSINTMPLSYDFKEAQKKMRSAGLDNGYANALSSGIWPSHDILPKTEKEKQGKAISGFRVDLRL